MTAERIREIEKSLDDCLADDPNWEYIWEVFDEAKARVPIPVSVRLPDDLEPKLGYSKQLGWMRFRMYSGQRGWKDEDWGFHTDVTHWMPLPPSPE